MAKVLLLVATTWILHSFAVAADHAALIRGFFSDYITLQNDESPAVEDALRWVAKRKEIHPGYAKNLALLIQESGGEWDADPILFAQDVPAGIKKVRITHDDEFSVSAEVDFDWGGGTESTLFVTLEPGATGAFQIRNITDEAL